MDGRGLAPNVRQLIGLNALWKKAAPYVVIRFLMWSSRWYELPLIILELLLSNL